MRFQQLINPIVIHSKNHLGIKGNTETRKKLIACFAEDTRILLEKKTKEDSYISIQEITDFYKKQFTDLKT